MYILFTVCIDIAHTIDIDIQRRMCILGVCIECIYYSPCLGGGGLAKPTSLGEVVAVVNTVVI